MTAQGNQIRQAIRIMAAFYAKETEGHDMVNVKSAARIGLLHATKLALMIIAPPCFTRLTLPVAAVVRQMTALPKRVAVGGPIFSLPLAAASTIAECQLGLVKMPLSSVESRTARTTQYRNTVFLWRKTALIRLSHTRTRTIVFGASTIIISAIRRRSIKSLAALSANKFRALSWWTASPILHSFHNFIIAYAVQPMGVGSEVYGATLLGRRGVGIELKSSYFKQALANMREVGAPKQEQAMLDIVG